MKEQDLGLKKNLDSIIGKYKLNVEFTDEAVGELNRLSNGNIELAESYAAQAISKKLNIIPKPDARTLIFSWDLRGLESYNL